MAHYREGMQVDDGDGVVGGAGDVGAGSIGLHQDAGGSVADRQTLDHLARGRVEDHQVGSAEKGDQDALSVRSEFEAVGAIDIGGQGVHYFLLGEIDDGDGSVLRVGDPDFL